MAALTLAGTRTPLSKASVTLALSPSSAMDWTEPTGTSAICTWAPLARSPTSLKTAVAVRCDAPPDTSSRPRAHDQRRRGRATTARRPAARTRCAVASEPALHVVHPARQEARCACAVACGLGLGQRRRASEAAGAVSVGLRWREAAVEARVAVGWLGPSRDLVGEQAAEPGARGARAARRARTRARTGAPSSRGSTPSRPHGVVVVVVGRRRSSSWWSWRTARCSSGTARRGATASRRRAAAPCSALGDLARGPCCRSDCAVVGAAPAPVSVSRMVGMSLSRGSKKPDEGLPHWVSVASTAADRPVEWLATMRRQMPASRSRRRPAM